MRRRAMIALLMWSWIVCPLAADREEIAVPRSLIRCLASTYDNNPLSLATDARRWAIELLDRDEVTLTCQGQPWVLRLTEE